MFYLIQYFYKWLTTTVNLAATFLRLADLSNYVMKQEISQSVTIHAQRTGQITCQICCVHGYFLHCTELRQWERVTLLPVINCF
jgi:hypothetical protein